MILKLTFPAGMREFLDTLKVQLPIAEFLEPLSDLMQSLIFPCFKRIFKRG